MPARVQHVFVLMLENRSFDHLFGFSDLTGVDAATGSPTVVEGLTGRESNSFDGTTYPVTRGADYAMPADPGHELANVLDQLCGPGARYVPPYPPIDSSGFVDSYDHTGGSGSVAEVMKCFDTRRQLPVLTALAQEFALCDHWFSSLPGPTWPNRMFVHAASSGGLDHSPSTAEILEWELLDGFDFPRGTIFEALQAKGVPYRLYSGDEFPMAAALKGITLADVHRIDQLLADLQTDPFPYGYVFIEPSYNVLHDYRNSSCQHPLSDVRDGEALIKQIYEALRQSKAWESSLLVITWDEHGGFYDHVRPPRATPPGDTATRSKYNQYGFTFEQYGVRTAGLVVSPLVPRGTIDHRTYDHASVPATLEGLFQMAPLTARDASARSLLSVLSLDTPRTDTPALLPVPSAPPTLLSAATPLATDTIGAGPVPVSRPDATINSGNLTSVIHSALRQQLLLQPGQRAAALARVAALRTRGDAMGYLREVQQMMRGSVTG